MPLHTESQSYIHMMFNPATVFIIACLALCGAKVGNAGEPPPPEACHTPCITSYGKVLGKSPAGVVAYSNCSGKCVSKDANRFADVYTGMQWQCVEFARRWLYRTQGVVFESVDDAYNIWDSISYLVDVKSGGKQHLRNYPNGSSELPRRGDLLIWSSDYLGTGHVAIVMRVDQQQGYVEVAEQNFLNREWQGSYARRIPLQQREGGIWLDAAHLLGWKRRVE